MNTARNTALRRAKPTFRQSTPNSAASGLAIYDAALAPLEASYLVGNQSIRIIAGHFRQVCCQTSIVRVRLTYRAFQIRTVPNGAWLCGLCVGMQCGSASPPLATRSSGFVTRVNYICVGLRRDLNGSRPSALLPPLLRDPPFQWQPAHTHFQCLFPLRRYRPSPVNYTNTYIKGMKSVGYQADTLTVIPCQNRR